MPDMRSATGATPQGGGTDAPALPTIPLFPLNTVLFPGGPLPLRIFETRYIDLVRRCLREDSGFGVVRIVEGAEAGLAPLELSPVGCYAKIVDFSQQPDGLLGIQTLGQRRFRIHERFQAADGLNFASIDWLPEPVAVALPEEFAELVPILDNVLDESGEPYASLERRADDASWVAARLAEVLPIPAEHKQHCLELDDPIECLRYLRPMFEIAKR